MQCSRLLIHSLFQRLAMRKTVWANTQRTKKWLCVVYVCAIIVVVFNLIYLFSMPLQCDYGESWLSTSFVRSFIRSLSRSVSIFRLFCSISLNFQIYPGVINILINLLHRCMRVRVQTGWLCGFKNLCIFYAHVQNIVQYNIKRFSLLFYCFRIPSAFLFSTHRAIERP